MTIRVLHVINQFSARAGAELSLRDILFHTHPRWFRHGLVVLRSKNNRLEGLVEREIPVFVPRSQLESRWSQVRHVRHAIAEFRPQLVHTVLFDADVAGRVAARMSHVPALTSLVNTPYVPEALMDRSLSRWKWRATRRVDRLLARHATTGFHAITDAVAVHAAAELGIDLSRIHVVPRGRDPTALGAPSPERRAAVRRTLGLDDGVPVLLNVARQEPQKGQRYLIEALKVLHAQHPEVQLLIAGREGASTAALSNAIDELDVRDAVRLLGVRRDIGDLLSAADVFVFPSLYEGLGGAVIEAMAMSLPIVASDIPALREVLGNGRCGRLVPMADSAALAEAIGFALANPTEARAMGDEASKRFASHYELSRCIAGMEEMYLTLARQFGLGHSHFPGAE